MLKTLITTAPAPRRKTLTTPPAAPRRKALAIAMSALILAAACSSDGAPGAPGISGSAQPDATADAATTTTTSTEGSEGTVIELGPEDVVLTARLVRFDDCGTLLDYLHEEYSARVGPRDSIGAAGSDPCR